MNNPIKKIALIMAALTCASAMASAVSAGGIFLMQPEKKKTEPVVEETKKETENKPAFQTKKENISGDIIFTVHQVDAARTKDVLEKAFADSPDTEIEIDTDAVKLMVSGVGMQGKPGVAAKVFRCLWDAGVQIINISTSEIKISMLIRTEDADRATDALYENFDIVL